VLFETVWFLNRMIKYDFGCGMKYVKVWNLTFYYVYYVVSADDAALALYMK
jgi:hypothetical protein